MGEPEDARSLLGKAPWSPPIVEMGDGIVAHLLCWELHERDGSWSAWVSWVQSTGTPSGTRNKLVPVRAGLLSPLDAPRVAVRHGRGLSALVG